MCAHMPQRGGDEVLDVDFPADEGGDYAMCGFVVVGERDDIAELDSWPSSESRRGGPAVSDRGYC